MKGLSGHGREEGLVAMFWSKTRQARMDTLKAAELRTRRGEIVKVFQGKGHKELVADLATWVAENDLDRVDPVFVPLRPDADLPRDMAPVQLIAFGTPRAKSQ